MTKNRLADSTQLPPPLVRLERLIGEGGFGTVYRGEWSGPVAVKEIQDPTAALKEAVLLRAAQHDNVVQLCGITGQCIGLHGEVKQLNAVVTKWCEGKSLSDHLRWSEGNSLLSDIYAIVAITEQLVNGMHFLHQSAGIIHGDLNSCNVFVTYKWRIKIGDFGLAYFSDDPSSRPVHAACFTAWCQAPELRDETALPTKASDVYTFGMIVYELLGGHLEADGSQCEESFPNTKAIARQWQHRYAHASTVIFLLHLVRRTVNNSPNGRPSFLEIANDHSWSRSISSISSLKDVDKLFNMAIAHTSL